MFNIADVHIRTMVEQLMDTHALVCMYKSSENKVYLESARAWIPHLETTMLRLKRELEKDG